MCCAPPPPHLGGGFACRLPEPIESYRSMIRCYSTRICRHHTIRTPSSASGFIMPAHRIEFMASIWTSYLTASISAVNSAIPFVPAGSFLFFYIQRHSALQQALLFEFTPGCQVSLWARSESSAKERFLLLVDGMGGSGGAADGTGLGRPTATEAGKASR